MKFKIKQWLKMLVQNIFLPFVYCVCCLQKPDGRLVVFADAHHNERPESMHRLYEALSGEPCEIVEMYADFEAIGILRLLKEMCGFMKRYAKAGTVVICDNYLPVAACAKRRGTKVIQLWHGAGAFKKFGYDAVEDIPPYYKGNVYKNYDMVTVSSEECVKYFTSAMRQNRGVVRPVGISRTDAYFDSDYKEGCRERIYKQYPELRGKKVLLWAPTFRGNAAMPSLAGFEDMGRLEKLLGDEWHVVYSLHPHLRRHLPSGTEQMEFSTEVLITVADVFVTDYSSVMYDAALLACPLLLFVPDLERFERQRGFYMPLEDFPGEIVTNGGDLKAAVIKTMEQYDEKKRIQFCEKYLSACDGKATERIVKYILDCSLNEEKCE